MKRRFTKSARVWEIEVSAVTVTVTGDGKLEVKTHRNEAAAQADATARIWDKLAKGYEEAGAKKREAKAAPKTPKKAAPAEPMKTTLVAPEGKRPLWFLVADKELTTIAGSERTTQPFASAEDAAAHLELVIGMRKREGYRVGETVPATEAELNPVELNESDLHVEHEGGTWHGTFTADAPAKRATCDLALESITRAAPRFVHIGCDLGVPGANWVKAIAGRTFPSITSWAFDTEFQTPSRQSENDPGDLVATLDACPNLERAFFTGKLALSSPPKHTQLRELTLLGVPLAEELVRTLANAELRALERLVISLASHAASECDVTAVADVVSNLGAAEIFVDGVQSVAELIDALAKRERSPTLKTLALGPGNEDEVDALRTALERHAEWLRPITLALPFERCFTDELELDAKKLGLTLADTNTFAEMLLPAVYTSWGH